VKIYLTENHTKARHVSTALRADVPAPACICIDTRLHTSPVVTIKYSSSSLRAVEFERHNVTYRLATVTGLYYAKYHRIANYTSPIQFAFAFTIGGRATNESQYRKESAVRVTVLPIKRHAK